ncbi:MAG TPA: 1-deoxy-D-xylulose-5-phosphate reductoisomerase [Spongiibacteraceae bacterium]|nr:1-deoxy-D-xylulose-5-phosphate reductoisomerase [Spongiibacteraceae bacterium]
MKDVTPKFVTVLGATGSIGASTLDVIARHPDRYRVFALTANTGVEKLLPLIERFQPPYVVLRDAAAAAQLRAHLLDKNGHDKAPATEVLSGCEGLIQVAADPRVDVVVAAIVGAAGLEPTMAAVRADKQILLANKETLVMAGHLFMAAVAASKAVLLPVDSEHNAIFQCLPAAYQDGSDGRRGLGAVGVRKILLTGSGGPFRNTPLSEFVSITPAQAIAHPNWSMGPKISVDSATMMNKGLELIEACWLFDARPEQVQIVIHPQSVIHSMVEYSDGSILAQLGNPDMRTPIAHALAWPERITSGVGSLDLIAQGRLDFQAPDEQRFPCLRLAAEAMRRGGSAPAVLNAANEIAVAAFLAGELRFIDIPVLIEQVMADVPPVEPHSLTDVQNADRDARRIAAAVVGQLANR